jgi:hypothetical protein
MTYIENPKTKGSGILCAISQTGRCPMGCPDCFFQSGRSYLEPFEENLPNMPTVEQARGRVVRMNDGNDSNNKRETVIASARYYQHAFFNTAIPKDLAGFERPVVLTVNPGRMTDEAAYCPPEPLPSNIMFVRVRTNTWNLDIVDGAVSWWTDVGVPVVLTFLAYYTEALPYGHGASYEFRQRTTNSYWVLTDEAYGRIVERYRENPMVYTCGRDNHTYSCARCGVCLREYFATMERMGVAASQATECA